MPQQLNPDQVRAGGIMPPARRRGAIAAVVTVVLTALASCLAPRVTETGPAPDRVVPPMFRMMYLPDAEDQRIAQARESLIGDCMAAHGQSYVTHVEDTTEDEALAALRPFGPESLDNLTDDPLPEEPVHSEEYARALFGDPDQRVAANGERLGISLPANGCQAEAEYRMLGDQRTRALELRLRIYDGERDAREALDRDPAFVAANDRWRRCVGRFGFDAENPVDLLTQLPDDADLASDPAVRADVGCKRETGYLDTAYARLAVLQQNWLDAHADLVTEWRELRHRQDTVARRVLG
jgi:hypothetical protein